MMNATPFTSGLAGAASAAPSAFRQRLGRMIEAVREQAARIQDEQRSQPQDGGGYTRPDAGELDRAAVLADVAQLLNELATLETEISAFAATWARLATPKDGR